MKRRESVRGDRDSHSLVAMFAKAELSCEYVGLAPFVTSKRKYLFRQLLSRWVESLEPGGLTMDECDMLTDKHLLNYERI